jgi:hypothetical protein
MAIVQATTRRRWFRRIAQRVERDGAVMQGLPFASRVEEPVRISLRQIVEEINRNRKAIRYDLFQQQESREDQARGAQLRDPHPTNESGEVDH